MNGCGRRSAAAAGFDFWVESTADRGGGSDACLNLLHENTASLLHLKKGDGAP